MSAATSFLQEPIDTFFESHGMRVEKAIYIEGDDSGSPLYLLARAPASRSGNGSAPSYCHFLVHVDIPGTKLYLTKTQTTKKIGEETYRAVNNPATAAVMSERFPLDDSLRVGLLNELSRAVVGLSVFMDEEFVLYGLDAGVEFKTPASFRIYEEFFTRVTAKPDGSGVSPMPTVIVVAVRLSDIVAETAMMTELVQTSAAKIFSNLRRVNQDSLDAVIDAQQAYVDDVNKLTALIDKTQSDAVSADNIDSLIRLRRSVENMHTCLSFAHIPLSHMLKDIALAVGADPTVGEK